jgi:DNA-directed RNA polymerase specialized sigma24 family protein
METLLRSLPVAHREIIVATYLRRQTTQQAARRLGISPAEAKARLYYAMQDLAARLNRPDAVA